ncbi:MAG TPA: LysR family transcriptional regulator [Azospirillaceae bacterium]|nr:LysR family transcriptional regulator [Azospirillaceae bacterium]
MQSLLAWDDLRLILEIARSGGLSGAARTLRLNHATVFRRLNGIETRIGVRLFDRFRTGYAPTPAGESAVALAERVEAEVRELELRLAGQDLRPSGTVRITTTDTLLSLLGPCLTEVRREHPEIVLEFVVSNAFLSLTRREADVAVRPTREPPPELVGRRVSAVAYAIYGVRGEAAGSKVDPFDRLWVAPDDSLSGLGAARWMRANVDPARIVGRADSVVGLLEMAKAGLGLAALPCFLGDREDGLERVRGPDPAMETALWLLTHDDLRGVARVRAVLNGLAEALARRRDLLEGRAVGGGRS